MITVRRISMGLLALVAVAGIVATIGNASSSGEGVARAFDSKCGVFPEADVPADAPSLPDQRAWNQDISKAPVHRDSDRIVDYINSNGGTDLHPDFGSPKIYGIPFEVVGKRTKPVKVRFTAYGDESDRGKYRIPLSARIEGGKNGDGDRHAIGYDKQGCKLYELYRAFPKKGRWEADSGATWNLKSAELRTEGFTSADAAGLPIFPGLIRYDEVQAGEIDHAIRVTFDSTRDAYVNPGSHCAGDTSSAAAPPMGMRMRLKSSFNTSGFRGQSAVIVTALKRYGFIVADNGSNWFFQGGTDGRWNDDDLNQLKEIPGSAFEVVESEAPLVTC